MMFDDTYDHEVWNDTDGIRVVLFMDVIRPMNFPASAINSGIINIIKHTGYILPGKTRKRGRINSRMKLKNPYSLYPIAE